MSTPLLTIIVPTYKRSAQLEILLSTLRDETAAVSRQVTVYVSDNCSPDDTPEVIARLAADWPSLRSYRHATNIGPEGNFCHAVAAVQTRWFWIIGDDDLPKRGVVAQVVMLLARLQPALVYMQSEWINPVLRADQGEQFEKLRFRSMDARTFAKTVHVWVTFISGMIIDKQRLTAETDGHALDRFDNTSLIQLGWVLPLLKSGGPFLFVRERAILATKDNTGGYALLTVFGANFARIVKQTFGESSDLARTLIVGNLLHYLPGLIWGARNRAMTCHHTPEDPWPAMRREVGAHWLYWLLLVPLGRFPEWLAQPVFQSWRVFDRLQREWRRRFGPTSGSGAT